MTERFAGVTPQPKFPMIDLTPENERILAVRTANREHVEEVHGLLSWESGYIDQVNPVTRDVMSRVFSGEWSYASDASFYGVMVFEALLGYVDADVLQSDTVAIGTVVGRVLDYDGRELDRYRQRAIESMRDDGIRTKEAIDDGMQRFYKSATYYALVGAAVSRQIALDIKHHQAIWY